MAELEEQLSAILDNPEAMGQIMSLARSLSGGGKKEEKAAGPTLRTEPPQEESQGDSPDLSSLLGQVAPGLLGIPGKGRPDRGPAGRPAPLPEGGPAEQAGPGAGAGADAPPDPGGPGGRGRKGGRRGCITVISQRMRPIPE